MKALIPGYRKNIIKILTMFLVLFPWITYFKILYYSEMQSWVLANYDGMAVDVYFYYKEIFLIIMATFVLLFFIGERIFPDKKDKNVLLFYGNNKWLFILSAIFVGMALVSSIFAEDVKTAWWGLPTEGEGFFTILCYVIIMLAFYNYFGVEYGVKFYRRGMLALASITVTLTCLEFFCKSLLSIDAVKWLVGMGDYIETFSGNEVDIFKDAVALTFGNPNYYGGFVCLLIPFVVSTFFAAKNSKKLIISGLLTVGLVFCVMASNATTTFIVSLFEFLLVSIVFLVKSRADKKLLVRIGAISVCIIIGAVICNDSVLAIISNENSATGKVDENVFEIENIKLGKNTVALSGTEDVLNISYINGRIDFTDDKGEKLDVTVDENVFTFGSTGYEDLSVKLLVTDEVSEEIVAKLVVDAGYDDTIDFYILEDGSISGVRQNNSIVKDISDAGTAEGLKKYYGLFTGRGYAWVNSLPLIRNTIIKGLGPGHFIYSFKQSDYVGMLNTHGSTKYVIDKPHSMYLQYGINIGLIGMAAMIGLLILVLIRAGNSLRLSKTVDIEIVAGVASISGFLMYSIVNDSVVAVTPIMYMIAGVTLATASNYVGKNKRGTRK